MRYEYITEIGVKNQFIAYHRWDTAPEEVKFLRNWHRHVFMVTTYIEVGHGNREVEFFIAQNVIGRYLRDKWEGQEFEFSCEQIAYRILEYLNESTGWKVVAVRVSEDGENEALAQRSEVNVQSKVWLPQFINNEEEGSRVDLELMQQTNRRDLMGEVRTKCFAGFEAEGPHAGTPTLFIPNCCSIEEISEAMERCPPACLGHLYFGAGNNRTKSRSHYVFAGDKLRNSWTTKKVTFEIGEWQPEWSEIKDTRHQVTIVAMEKTSWCDWYKVVNLDKQTITWYENRDDGLAQTIITPFDHPFFKGDFYV
jgi:hypothetical protein